MIAAEVPPSPVESSPNPAPTKSASRSTGSRPTAAREALGLSRGGFGTKLHVIVDGQGLILHLQLTPGQAGESPQFTRLMEAIRPSIQPKRAAGDKGYSCHASRDYLAHHGIEDVIASRVNELAQRSKPFDAERYKQRNVVERAIGRIKEYRAVATRYDKLARNYRATIHAALIAEFLRRELPRRG